MDTGPTSRDFRRGIKYINAFNLRNFDLQLETNIVRPYTYQHNDSIDNYSHYNQPLAHPLGANFAEVIAIAPISAFLQMDAGR